MDTGLPSVCVCVCVRVYDMTRHGVPRYDHILHNTVSYGMA